MTGNMVATRQPNDLYPPIPTEAFRALLASLRPIGNELPRALTVDETRALQTRSKQLASWIGRGKPDEIKKVVSRCFMGLGGEKVAPEQAAMMMAQYVLALSDSPLWAIERACMKFARGEVKAADVGARHLEAGMRPSSAHLQMVVKDITEAFDAEIASISKVLAAFPPRRAETDAERAEGLAKTKAWQEQKFGKRDNYAPAPDGHRERVRAQLAQRHRDRILREYAEAGLPVPTGEIITSLPFLIDMGWTIVNLPDGSRQLAKPQHVLPSRASRETVY